MEVSADRQYWKAEATPSRRPARTIAATGGIVAAAAFFMPWFSACGETFSGAQIATQAGSGQVDGSWALLWGVLVAAATIIAVAMVAKGAAFSLFTLISSAVGAGLVGLAYASMADDSRIDVEFGLYIELVGFGLAALASFVPLFSRPAAEPRPERVNPGPRALAGEALLGAALQAIPPTEAHNSPDPNTPQLRSDNALHSAVAEVHRDNPVNLLVPGTDDDVAGETILLRQIPRLLNVTELRDGVLVSEAQVQSGVVLGRDQACGLVTRDPGASRSHVRFSESAGLWFVRDLETTNGTFILRGLEWQRVGATPEPIGTESVLRVGSSKFVVKPIAQPQARPFPGQSLPLPANGASRNRSA